MQVEYLTDDDGGRWDAYVGARAVAATDLFAWRFVAREAYGIRSHFLLATDAGPVVGGLALFEVRHPVFGHYLATALFGTDGGFLFENTEARDALLAEARSLLRRTGATYALLRTRRAELPDVETDRRFSAPILDLASPPERVWDALPSKTRNQVRRGTKESFAIDVGMDQCRPFFAVFHRHMRHLGSPAHGMPFYEAIQRHLPTQAQFFFVRDGATPVGGALVFFVNGVASNYHTVTLREFNPRCANYLLYWRIIETAIARGCRQLDMGRSENQSSQLAFKRNWTDRVEPLQYNYLLSPGAAAPRLDPRNPRYRVAIAAWQRMPLAFTRMLGPHLISGIA